MRTEEFIEVFIERAVLPPEGEVLRRHVSEGETENVLLSLPTEIRLLVE